MGNTLTGFNSKDPKFDKIKYIRQLRAVVHWKRQKGRGTIEAATGFGKTVIALIIIAKVKLKKPEHLKHGGKILIVVPTTNLKEQWIKILKNAGFYSNIEVQVINTVSLSDGFQRTVDLLIIDEVHMMAADKFRRVFTRVKYSWILGLTATMKRLDGKEIILKQVAPICDTISQKEAILKGWISDFIEFNLAVPITRFEAEAQATLNKSIRYYTSRFGNFDNMLACMAVGNAKTYAQHLNQSQPPHEQYSAQDVIKWAIQGIRLIHTRKNFLDNTEHKINAAVELVKEFNIRTIMFSQSTTFANEVAKQLGKDAVLYHTQIPSVTRNVIKEREFKTIKAAENFKMKQESLGYKTKLVRKKDTILIKYIVPKQISGKKQADENFQSFIQKKAKWIVSAKKLDQGFDDDSVELGVDSSRSENSTQHIQRTGRISRNFRLPNGELLPKIYVNLYVPNWSVPGSRDEQKLKACQIKNPDNVVWVDDLTELKTMLRSILKRRANDKSIN